MDGTEKEGRGEVGEPLEKGRRGPEESRRRAGGQFYLEMTGLVEWLHINKTFKFVQLPRPPDLHRQFQPRSSRLGKVEPLPPEHKGSKHLYRPHLRTVRFCPASEASP